MERDASSSKSSYYSTVLPWLICAAGALFFCYEYLLRITPSVMRLPLMQTFHINNEMFGMLSAFYFYAYTPLQLPVGLLMDKFGPRRLLTIASLVCAVGMVLFSLPIFPIAATGRFLVGAGSAFALIGVLKLATIWLPATRFAMIAGLVTALGMLGPMLGDVILTPLVGNYGWHNTVIYTAIIGVFLSAFLYATIRDTHTPAARYNSQSISFKELAYNLKKMLSTRQIWCAGLISSFLFTPISILAELWGIPYLQQGLHLSVSASAWANPLIFLGFAIGGILSGWISDKIKRRREPIIIGSLLAAITACILIYTPTLSAPAIYTLLFSLGFFAGAEVIVFAVSRESVPTKVAATAMAATNFLGMLGTLNFQPIVGRLLDYHAQAIMHHGVLLLDPSDYRFALTTVPICLGISAVLAALLRETGENAVNLIPATE
jgi:MFS family permease